MCRVGDKLSVARLGDQGKIREEELEKGLSSCPEKGDGATHELWTGERTHILDSEG